MATSAAKYPGIVTQTAQKVSNVQKIYREFSNLGNIKKAADYAQSSALIAGKTGTHRKPSIVTCTNFGISIPTGAKITAIKVEYAHQKVDYKGGSPRIGAPTISLMNVSGQSKTGTAPTTTMTARSVTFSFNPSTSNITSSNFGVRINYPENANTNEGYLRLRYVRVIVIYTPASYTVSITKADNNSKTVGDTIDLNVGINNVNKVSSIPSSITVSLPSGVTFNGKVSGDGSFKVSGSTVKWTSGLSSSKFSSSAKIRLNLNTEGTKSVSIKENLLNNTKTVSIVVNPNVSQEPVEPTEPSGQGEGEPPEDDDNSGVGYKTLNMVTESPYELTIKCADDPNTNGQPSNGVLCGAYISFRNYAQYFSFYIGETELTSAYDVYIPASYFDENNEVVVTIIPHQPLYVNSVEAADVGEGETPWYVGNECVVDLTGGYDATYWCILNVKPSDSDSIAPVLSVLPLAEEELNRMANGHAYTVHSFLKCVSDELINWPKNFRIGVFNNRIGGENNPETDEEEEIEDDTDYTNLSSLDIFTNTGIWSTVLTKVNEFESKTVEFTYDENYPVYIVLTGEYEELSSESSLDFTIPSVIESNVFDDYFKESNFQCIFPTPIRKVLVNPEDVGDDFEYAELELADTEHSNSFIVENFNDAEGLGTDEDSRSVLGVQLNLTLDIIEDMVIIAKLISPEGVSGDRSIKITAPENKGSSENTISLGGQFDLWGFETKDMEDLEDWKVEISFDNPWTNSKITFKNIELVYYVNKVKDNVVKCYINGVDVRHYGMFVQKPDIPFGLATDVKYIDIDGTDQHTAYRQTIKKKEISFDFNVRGCNIEETTNYLKMLSKLFTNKRDKLNMPIPNKLEFSHRPDEYWLVVMENPFDTDAKVINYQGTVKLVVPDGTSYANNATVTGVVGTNSSLTKCSPVIEFTPNISEDNPISSLSITERNSNQKMIIQYDKFVLGDSLKLDCANKTLILKNGQTEKNLIDAVDWNADWFELLGNYHFDTENCSISTVSFVERW